ncbi:hypothetical protein BU17DRAFT_62225 [Hysterangium stoloniferum]|nr:hypothetical protein BU17DRAFT_62225 [Hysterangium stoloniferum]
MVPRMVVAALLQLHALGGITASKDDLDLGNKESPELLKDNINQLFAGQKLANWQSGGKGTRCWRARTSANADMSFSDALLHVFGTSWPIVVPEILCIIDNKGSELNWTLRPFAKDGYTGRFIEWFGVT